MKKLITLLFAFAILTTLQAQEKRLALVIGNSDYKHSSLQYSANDAELMEATLNGLDFTVIKAVDATKSQMEQAIRQFSERLRRYNVVLFFYSGHGIQNSGENYLIPIDARLEKPSDLKYEALPISIVMEELANHSNKTNIIILDGCQGEQFVQWRNRPPCGFKSIEPARGTIVAFAANPGEATISVKRKNSLYVSKLVEQMTIVQSVETLFENISYEVSKASRGRQVPQKLGRIRNDFSFAKLPPNKNQRGKI